MRKIPLVVAVAALCGGCVYQDLKAPCADNVASLSLAAANNVPCDKPQPVNMAAVDLAWATNEE